MSIRVGEGTRVTLAYRLQTERGDVLEERTPENPFEFSFGSGQTLPAIENVIRGKTEGFTASLGVAAKEAYGEFDDQLVATVPVDSFPKPQDVQVGMKFTTLGPNGEELAVRVVEVLEDQVTVDGNHPLAGVDIEIDLKILRVEINETASDEDAGSDSKSGSDSDPESDSESGGRILH
jgi:FKBP-type peptidyl-prolyl cis-trans isomerase SlyD